MQREIGRGGLDDRLEALRGAEAGHRQQDPDMRQVPIVPLRETPGMRKIHFDHIDHRVLPKLSPRASRASAAFLPPGGYIIDDLAARQRRG